MCRAITILTLYLTLACFAARAGAQTFEPATSLRLEPVASGLSGGLYLTAPANDSRLFIVEQPGRIRIVRNGELLPTSFLDIRTQVSSGGSAETWTPETPSCPAVCRSAWFGRHGYSRG